jgi:hypothetical protein
MSPAPAAAMLCLALAGPAPAEDAAPVLVELFTSEGCSSCPPADLLLARLLSESPGGGRLIALGEHVDYWDDLGWRDRFSSPLFTRRQEAYARRLRTTVFTPQLVVNGSVSATGSDPAAVRAAVSSARGLRSVRVEVRPGGSGGGGLEIRFEAAWPGGVAGEVYLALVQDRAASPVSRGENAGRTLAHVAVARSLARVGSGTGACSGRLHLSGADPADADRLVVFVQEPGGGPVLAAGTATWR